MSPIMEYPRIPALDAALRHLRETARLAAEEGAGRDAVEAVLTKAADDLTGAIDALRALPGDAALRAREPDGLAAIRALRPPGPRVLSRDIPADYPDRLRGALLGRMAGCTLGAPVEGWSVEAMQRWARYTGDAFPPADYWRMTKSPEQKRYAISTYEQYTRQGLDGVPVDDDITYTILGLLILEEYGPGFTVDDVGAAWLRYLPYACTAEEIALNNLKAGVPTDRAADKDNPYVQWIGADIRSDPWGYMAPGRPELAAEWAWRDAFLSHRRNGIYGEMYFSAAIAAAFTAGSVREALETGLAEIPVDCLLARDIRWALREAPNIADYRHARQAVEERFGDMSPVHTNNNACLTLFGLMIGGDDFSRVIGETVAMGYDNDCTAATAGSLYGAVHGAAAIPGHWVRPFGDRLLTYMNGQLEMSIEDVLERFEAQARRAAEQR